MSAAWTLFVALAGLLSLAAQPNEAARLRFSGPAKIQQLPTVLQRQEAAPYPPAGLKPDTPFELPTEQAAEFPDAEPELVYGPPETQPDLTYGPPETQPDETYGPPDLTYGPPETQPDETQPDQTYGPPETEPDQTYGPPIDGSSSDLPQSANIISLNSLRPQAQFILPLVQRFLAFRPPQRPVQGQRKPAKLINGAKAVFPATQLTLPFVDRRFAFRPARLIVGAPLKPAKLSTVNRRPAAASLAQLTPAIRRPIYSNGRIIGYSAKPQNFK